MPTQVKKLTLSPDRPFPRLSGEAKKMAALIDHTLLKPEATPDDVVQLCQEAVDYGFASVCVNSGYVPLCVSLLQETEVPVCSVVGFPLGASLMEAKAAETRLAVEEGAGEIDMVLAIGRLKAGEDDFVRKDIRAVVEAANGALVKVIIETALLTDEEKVRACRLAVEAGAHFVKTSTGFSKAGATVEDVTLMRKVVGPEIGVKAAGGIRDFPTAQAMVAAGANRIGASSSVRIVTEVKGN
jgi:deoxyribose-phosphate aldolase